MIYSKLIGETNKQSLQTNRDLATISVDLDVIHDDYIGFCHLSTCFLLGVRTVSLIEYIFTGMMETPAKVPFTTEPLESSKLSSPEDFGNGSGNVLEWS